MIVNLVTRDNGVGLTTDMELLESLLIEHDMERVDWLSKEMRACDVAIFLELLNPQLMRYAKNTVGIFNLEWFEGCWVKHLPRMTQLWAKSSEAHDAYTGLGLKNSILTGFLGRDFYDPSVGRTDTCLHLQGHSSYKGTSAVLEAWRTNDDLPPLTIISAKAIPHVPPGVTVLPPVSQAELIRHLNTARVHVCPSETEGWGHYIAEAMSTQAVVVTTDAPPMNDHVTPDCGVLVSVSDQHMRGRMVRKHMVKSVDELADGVWRAMEMDDGAGKLARARMLRRNGQFREIATELVRSLDARQ